MTGGFRWSEVGQDGGMGKPNQVSRHAQRMPADAVGYPSLSPDDSGIYEQIIKAGTCSRCGQTAQRGKTQCRPCQPKGSPTPLPPLTEEQQREQVWKMNQWQAKRDMQELAARLEQEQSEREIGPWRSGGGRGWYIGSASDWKRRIKRK